MEKFTSGTPRVLRNSNGMETKARKITRPDTSVSDVSQNFGLLTESSNLKRTSNIPEQKKDIMPSSLSISAPKYALRSHVAEKNIGLSQLGDSKSAMTKIGKKKSNSNANHIAELQQIAESQPQQLKENCPKMTEKEEESDCDNDDDLDDEQWYLKYAARWSGPIEVTGDILLNPVELKMYLKSHLHADRK